MHVPVLEEKVVEYLNPQPNTNFIDCTLGNGGFTKKILEKNGPKGKVLGIDWDPQALKNAKKEIPNAGTRLILENDNYARLKEIAEREKFDRVQGILLDLGISSEQVDTSRGFTFRRNETLDMRFNPAHTLDAQKILNFWSKFEIERILKEYGEEQFAESIAKAIVEARSKAPIIKTFQLAQIVKNATPAWYSRRKLHWATKTFQALRIATNGELENLKAVLPQAVSLLNPGGRLAVISFHSLEDRIVKNFFKENPALKIITKKPVVPAYKEQKQNPRSRSAKLRVAQKI